MSLTNTNEKFQLAQTQTHNTYMGRKNVVQEATLPEYVKNPFAGRELQRSRSGMTINPNSLSLRQGHEYKQHHWGMAIDMNAYRLWRLRGENVMWRTTLRWLANEVINRTRDALVGASTVITAPFPVLKIYKGNKRLLKIQMWCSSPCFASIATTLHANSMPRGCYYTQHRRG